MIKKRIDIKRHRNAPFDLIMLVFWGLFSFLSTFEGYFQSNIGGITRYVLLFWFIIMVLKIGRQYSKITIDQFLWLAWLSYYFISIIWTNNIDQARIYILTITLMTLLCISLQYFLFSATFCKYIMVLFKASSILLAFLSIFFYTYIGDGTRRVLLIFNNYVDPNGQVATIAIGSGLCLWDIFSSDSFTKRTINFFCFIISCYSILQTGSRSGIIILLVQILIVLLLWHPKKNNMLKESKKWIIVLLIFLIAFYFVNSYISADITDRLLGRGDLDFFDGTQREERWQVGLEYFYRHPLFGNGWGAFECHNTYLTMLVDIGIIGNLLFYSIIIRLFVKAYKLKEIKAIIILFSGLVPAFFIGAQNKRFFWAAIIIATILIQTKEFKKNEINTK